MASELKTTVAGLAATPRPNDEHHSRAARQQDRAGVNRNDQAARLPNGTATLDAIQTAVAAATDRVLNRLNTLDNGPGSSVGGPCGPLAERVEECVRVGEQTLRLVTDSGAATAAALSSTATSTVEQLRRVADDVQRLGIDTPRFHAGILDQLHRQGEAVMPHRFVLVMVVQLNFGDWSTRF